MSTRWQEVPAHINVQAMPPRHAASGAARPTVLLIDAGTKKQEKTCCRFCTAVSRSYGTCMRISVGHIEGCRFFVFICLAQNQETHNNTESSTKGSKYKLTKSERTAALTLTTCALLPLLLLLFWCRTSSAVDVLHHQ